MKPPRGRAQLPGASVFAASLGQGNLPRPPVMGVGFRMGSSVACRRRQKACFVGTHLADVHPCLLRSCLVLAIKKNASSTSDLDTDWVTPACRSLEPKKSVMAVMSSGQIWRSSFTNCARESTCRGVCAAEEWLRATSTHGRTVCGYIEDLATRLCSSDSGGQAKFNYSLFLSQLAWLTQSCMQGNGHPALFLGDKCSISRHRQRLCHIVFLSTLTLTLGSDQLLLISSRIVAWTLARENFQFRALTSAISHSNCVHRLFRTCWCHRSAAMDSIGRPNPVGGHKYDSSTRTLYYTTAQQQPSHHQEQFGMQTPSTSLTTPSHHHSIPLPASIPNMPAPWQLGRHSRYIPSTGYGQQFPGPSEQSVTGYMGWDGDRKWDPEHVQHQMNKMDEEELHRGLKARQVRFPLVLSLLVI